MLAEHPMPGAGRILPHHPLTGPRKTPKASPPKTKPADPVFAAIDGYWDAVAAWRKSRDRLRRVSQRTPSELKRAPRVQIGRIREHDDRGNPTTAANGEPIYLPTYAEGEWNIKERLRKNFEHWLSIAAPRKRDWKEQPDGSWVGKDLPLTPELQERRRKLWAEHRKRVREKIAELKLDADWLRTEQAKYGYVQANEAEWRARHGVFTARYVAISAKPTTRAGAAALANFIFDAHRTYMNSSDREAPYGLSDHQLAVIGRNLASFLRGGA